MADEAEDWCDLHGADEMYYRHTTGTYYCVACEEEEALITAMEIIDG